MSRAAEFLQHCLRFCGAAIVSLAVWTLWLALSVVLIFQIYIVSIKELAVPGWLLKSLEQRLEVSGIRAKFGRTSFDPSGRLLIQDANVMLPSFDEPVLAASFIYVQLDPWSLLVGRFEPRELRIGGGRWLVPAMLSPSGRTEEAVRDFDTTLHPGGPGEIIVESLSGRIGTLTVKARGTVYIPPQPTKTHEGLPGAEFIARRYAALCRQLSTVAEKTGVLDQPSVEVELSPSESRGAIASIVLLARGVKLDAPVAFQATDLRLVTRFPLLGETPVMTRLEFFTEELRLPRNALARGVRAQIRGPLQPALLHFEPTELDLAADSASAEGLTTTALSAHLTPGPLPRLQAEVIARVMDGPLAIQTETDLAAKTATVRFEGKIAPGWLEAVSSRVGRDVRKFVDFKTPIAATGAEATFSAGWKFEQLHARIDTGEVLAYHVTIDEAHGWVELTPRRFFAAEAYARIQKNFARGSYENEFKTQDFRFLLEGQLEPLTISGWFGAWWPDFFKSFQFPGGAPSASVDVRGRWLEGRRTTVFVFADMNAVIVRGTQLDHARTLLFIRPGFYDAAEILGTRGSGVARGRFTYILNPATYAWQELSFEGTSSLDLAVASALIGPISTGWIAPFKFERPPELKIVGKLSHDAANMTHQALRISGSTDTGFRFQGFPLENLIFKTEIHDDEIAVDDVKAGFAGGMTTGRAKIMGQDPARRLSFEYALHDASLGRAIAVLQAFAAQQKGLTPSAPDKFIQEKNNVRLNLTAAAEGAYNDPFTYRGHGNADLKGAELGEVRLFGGLSETLRFTALRFTAATVNFEIAGPKLVFPEISVTGDNSAIQAHGDYALDRRQLDFYAKVYPFQESGSILKKILDVALTPLSNVFEVKLTGTLDKPSWGLVLGPSNFLRNLTQPEPAVSPPKAGETPPSTLPSAPPDESPKAPPTAPTAAP